MDKSALAISLCAMLVACGGGGGGSGNPDTQPPVVISLDPPNNSIGADVDESISAVFNEAIDATSVTTTGFTLQPASGGSAIAGTRTVGGSTVRFVPTAALAPSTLYTATIASTVRDAAGNSLGANTVWSFTTETDAWQATTNDANTPSGRDGHTSVWTGTEMIVWGGSLVTGVTATDTGARYLPASGSTPGVWTPTATTDAPSARSGHTAIWTGNEMIVWGGDVVGVGSTDSGARYTLGNGVGMDSWTATTATGAPSPRTNHTAAWTGSQMIIWGGLTQSLGRARDGGRYTPGASGGSWNTMATVQAPSAREGHTAIWTGTEMIVWGGIDVLGSATATGARYNPTTDTWLPISTVGAPAGRFDHAAIWTGTEMIVWGGTDGASISNIGSTGGRYDPATNTWSTMTTTGAPAPRVGHTIVWTGLEMIVWGGQVISGATNTGGRYRPSRNTWKPMSTATGVPSERTDHTAVWTGTNVIVWGGSNGTTMGDGGQYTP